MLPGQHRLRAERGFACGGTWSRLGDADHGSGSCAGHCRGRFAGARSVVRVQRASKVSTSSSAKGSFQCCQRAHIVHSSIQVLWRRAMRCCAKIFAIDDAVSSGVKATLLKCLKDTLLSKKTLHLDTLQSKSSSNASTLLQSTDILQLKDIESKDTL
jgi:hypothetical protein